MVKWSASWQPGTNLTALSTAPDFDPRLHRTRYPHPSNGLMHGVNAQTNKPAPELRQVAAAMALLVQTMKSSKVPVFAAVRQA